MPADTSSELQQVFLGRQPILGRDQQLLAYELLFRNGQITTGNHAFIEDATQATAAVITTAFAEFSVGDALGPYRGFINVDHDFLFSDLIELLPARSVVLEILENVEPTPEVIARCQALRQLGFTLAVDDVVQACESYKPLLAVAQIIKVDIKELDEARLRTLVGQLKPLGKVLLAEKVETREQMQFCANLGFELFQGYFFARPTIIAGKRLSHSQLTLMRLLALLMEDADSAEIEKAFKLEPGLTVNLLRLTNSAGNGLRTKITSLRHAIAILGQRQLQRWLQLLLYTTPKGGAHSSDPLLQLAATRGRLLELLAARVHPSDRSLADHAFMTGIMSLMPTLLGIEMNDIVAQLPIAQEVTEALLDGGGVLGDLLALVEATEKSEAGAITGVLTCRSSLAGLAPEEISTALSQALAWANRLGEE